MIEPGQAVFVRFDVETKRLRYINEFRLPEHLVRGMIDYLFEWNSDASFRSLGRQILEQEPAIGFQNPVHFCKRVFPVGHVVNDPEIDDQIETAIRKIEV
jgi:hypothetical protein